MSHSTGTARSCARALERAFTSTSASASASAESAPRVALASRSATRYASTFTANADDVNDVVKLYRGPHIKLFRALVRTKIAQLGAAVGLATPLFLSASDASGTLAFAGIACGVGSGACSAALQYYARRYVGELALVDRGKKLRVSTMDFWGARVDERFGVERVKPPLSNLSRGELEEIANRTFIPLDIIGERQYVVSLRHGDLLDAKKLFAVLGSDADARTSHATSPRTGRDASE